MAIKKVRMKPPGYTDIVHPETSADVVIEDSSHRFVTDSEKGIWNAKQAAITGGATTITSSNLTANRALVSNSSGKVAVSAVTSTQLGYLSGATGNIQTQINLKVERNNDVGSGTGVGTLTIADANLLQGFPALHFAKQVDLDSANAKLGFGGVIESGGNTNGSYIKYNDGTMICSGMLDISLANSRGYINKPLPVSLTSSDTSQVFFTSKYVNGVPSLEVDAVVIGGAVSGAATSINCYAAYYRNLGITWTINISYFVIGRWK